MAASRSVVERWAPRRICFSVRLAKKRSTWFIQEADVGVKCTCQRGRWANQLRIAWVLWLDTLSMTMWMSRSSGTLASMAFKNTRNSRARCRAKHRPMTLPVAASRAANRQRAVTGIIVGAALGLPGAPWQQGLGAVQSLDLTLLVHAQHKGVLGWGHVEPDDVAHLLPDERLARELEDLDPVRLQSEGFPDAVDCRRRVTHRLGHRAQRPMRRIRWSRFQRQTDRLGNLVIADLPRRSGTRLVVKPVDAMLGKAPTPFADGVLVGVERLSDRLVR